MEKMKKTKGYEPPDIHFLQKDFETCVLSGDIECQYIEGTDVEDYPGTIECCLFGPLPFRAVAFPSRCLFGPLPFWAVAFWVVAFWAVASGG